MSAKTHWQPICETVQQNCHIADARFATDDTLCIYLLKMREYFRWEQGFDFAETLPREPLAEWLMDREALWESLEQETFTPLQLNDAEIDPFATEDINAQLLNEGLVYSAGMGHRARPHFFLADLDSREETDGYTVLISSREHARDLSSPPAMTLGNTIFLRREALRRLLWQKVDEWRWNRPDNAMARAIACYKFDDQLDLALDQMTEHELESVRLHEIGEILAGRQLGPAWEELLQSQRRSRTELMLRAVRDLLADCISTLPALLHAENSASIHTYMGNLTGMRRELFPGLRHAYEAWLSNTDSELLTQLVKRGAKHWQALAQEILLLAEQRPVDITAQLDKLITDARL